MKNQHPSKGQKEKEMKHSKPSQPKPEPSKSTKSNLENAEIFKTDEEYSKLYNLSIQDVKDARDLFTSIDADGGGEIDASELKSLLESLGRPISSAEAKKLIDQVDSDGTGTVDFEEFLKLIAKESADEKTKDPVVEAHRIFDTFDKDHSGSIDFSELKQAMQSLGQTLSDEDLTKMMREADDDGTGEIDFEEFCALIGVSLPAGSDPGMQSKSANSTTASAAANKPNSQKAADPTEKIDPTAILTKDEIKNLKEIFALFDEDGSGSITIEELDKMMRGLGREVPEAALRDMIASVDADGTGAIEFDEFLILMARDAAGRDPLAEAARSFALFDADGSGTISADELGAALRASGQDVSNEDAARLLQTVDADGSGEIDFAEFCQLMGLDAPGTESNHVAQARKTAAPAAGSSPARVTDKQRRREEREALERERREEERRARQAGHDEWRDLVGAPAAAEPEAEGFSAAAALAYEFPLHAAAAAGDLEVVRGYCDGAGSGWRQDPNAADSAGLTPLMLAVSGGHAAVALFLLSREVAVGAADPDRRTALHLAVLAGDAGLATALLRSRAAPGTRDRFGDAPLHIAARRGAQSAATALLDAAADPSQPGGFGDTPLHWAARRGHRAVCDLLLDRGASRSAVDDAGLLPAEWARDPDLRAALSPPEPPPEPPTAIAEPAGRRAGAAGAAQAGRFQQGLEGLRKLRGKGPATTVNTSTVRRRAAPAAAALKPRSGAAAVAQRAVPVGKASQPHGKGAPPGPTAGDGDGGDEDELAALSAAAEQEGREGTVEEGQDEEVVILAPAPNMGQGASAHGGSSASIAVEQERTTVGEDFPAEETEALEDEEQAGMVNTMG